MRGKTTQQARVILSPELGKNYLKQTENAKRTSKFDPLNARIHNQAFLFPPKGKSELVPSFLFNEFFWIFFSYKIICGHHKNKDKKKVACDGIIFP